MEVKIPEIKSPDTSENKTTEETGVFPIYQNAIKFNGVFIFTGKDSPLNVIAAPLGSIYLNQSGGANLGIYVKETEVVKGDKTGWSSLWAKGGVLATTASTGHLIMPTCAGTPIGAPQTGSLVFDTVNAVTYIWGGASWIALN